MTKKILNKNWKNLIFHKNHLLKARFSFTKKLKKNQKKEEPDQKNSK